ncbi:MAG TPA: hypothetical protein VNE41_02560 [Chitinophagaceae bacterium]|nr:hypothetical protein [Chitinophagaceae bacterium]
MKIAAFLMIIFGFTEVVTSFRQEFFGLTIAQATMSTIIGAAIGTFYFTSGFLVLTKRRKAAIVAIVLLIADAIGRILMVLTGLYPIGVGYQTFGIITGTSIVIFFAIYIGAKLKDFV